MYSLEEGLWWIFIDMNYGVNLLQRLLRCKSITPDDGGTLEYLSAILTEMGFVCQRIEFQEEGSDAVSNLYARLGSHGSNFCFAGHVDVVPVGRVQDWLHDPFHGEISQGEMYGRGAVDMKGAIAAFIDALKRLEAQQKLGKQQSISVLLTADEEGIAINGTKKVVKWLEAKGEKIDLCLIGEPTSKSIVGDTIKIGARGSVTILIEVLGVQGHVAYHEIADNPITMLNKIMLALKSQNLDNGSIYFQPSNLEFTNLFVGNEAENVIPSAASARFNIRFGDTYTAARLATWAEGICREYTNNFRIKWHSSGEAFVTRHELLAPLVSDAVQEIVGIVPEINTLGGTSDARFLNAYCEVLELGLLNATAHKVNEKVSLVDLESLTQIYMHIIEKVQQS